MEVQIHGSPSFAYLDVELHSGESIIAESDAMATMSADLDVKARLNGGLFSGLCKKLLGKESLFINEFTNNRGEDRRITLAQSSPGDITHMDLHGKTICLQPGAYIASTSQMKLGAVTTNQLWMKNRSSQYSVCSSTGVGSSAQQLPAMTPP